MINIQSVILISMPGTNEWLLIGGIFLLLFGGKKIPELMRGLGKGISEFRKAKDDVDNEVRKVSDEVRKIKE